MRNFFKRNRPTQSKFGYRFESAKPSVCEPCVAKEDLAIAEWFGFTPAEWARLSRTSQVKFRDAFYSNAGL